MIEIILVWLYIYITSYSVGRFFVNGFFRKADGINATPVHPVFYSLAGLVVITIAAGYLSLFFKTGLLINVVLAAFSVTYLLLERKKLSGPVKSTRLKKPAVLLGIFLLAVFALVLVKSSGPISNPDSGAYHLPFIKWIEDYKAIKGLANVHSRFGFNYQYLVLCAVYGLSFTGLQTVHALNGYLMLLFIGYLITTLRYYRDGVLSVVDMAKLVMMVFVLNMSSAVPSFSPDFPTTIMNIMVILLTLHRIEQKTVYTFDREALIMLVLSVGAILFKISAAPILLFNLFYLLPLLKRGKIGIISGIAIGGVIALIPYLVRNYIISGYLVFPLYALDIFNVPWKLPLHRTIFEKEYIKYFALDLPYGAHPGAMATLRSWIHFLKTSNTASFFVVLILMGNVVLNLATFIRLIIKKQVREYGPYCWLYMILYVSLVYWWLNAPDVRFGNGFIIPFIGLTLAFTFYGILKRWQPLVLNGTYILLIVLCAGMIRGKALARVSNNFNAVRYNFTLQEKYPVPDLKVQYNERRQRYYMARDVRENACWNSALPCSYDTDTFSYGGNRIEDGFIYP